MKFCLVRILFQVLVWLLTFNDKSQNHVMSQLWKLLCLAPILEWLTQKYSLEERFQSLRKITGSFYGPALMTLCATRAGTDLSKIFDRVWFEPFSNVFNTCEKRKTLTLKVSIHFTRKFNTCQILLSLLMDWAEKRFPEWAKFDPLNLSIPENSISNQFEKVDRVRLRKCDVSDKK